MKKTLGTFLFIVTVSSTNTVWAYRPMSTEDAYVMEKGSAQLEVGHDYIRHGGDDSTVSGAYSFNGGIWDKTEINLNIPVIYAARRSNTDFDDEGNSVTTRRRDAGFSDLQLLAKYGMFQETSFLPAVSPEVIITFPTGSNAKGLGNPKTNYQLLTAVSKTFNRFDAHANLGWDFLNDFPDEIIIRAGTGVQITPGWRLVFE